MTFTHADLVILTRWMADDGGYTPADLADAVAAPWKHEVELAAAKLLASVLAS